MQHKKMTRKTGATMLKTRAGASRNGSITVVTVLGLLGLLGFCALATDYGMSVVIKNKLQRVCDASALAGATELLKSGVTNTNYDNARYQAKLTAYQNGVTLVDSDVTFPTFRTVRVGVAQRRNFFFGGAIGIPTGQVAAAAVAGRSYVNALTGALPLGITRATYYNFRPTDAHPNPGSINLRLTRNTQEQFGPLNTDNLNNGNTTFDVAALDLRYGNSGNSGALFQNELTNGSASQTIIGTQIDPLGSSITSQGNKLAQAIQDRINQAAGAPWYDNGSNYTTGTYPAGDPRVVYILVGADGYAANNSNPKLDLTFFAPAYITGPVTSTNKGGNTQTFLPLRFLPAVGLSSLATGFTLSEADNDTGLTVVRLTG